MTAVFIVLVKVAVDNGVRKKGSEKSELVLALSKVIDEERVNVIGFFKAHPVPAFKALVLPASVDPAPGVEHLVFRQKGVCRAPYG